MRVKYKIFKHFLNIFLLSKIKNNKMPNKHCEIDFRKYTTNHEIIEQCSQNIDNVILDSILGEGSHGTVYSGYINFNNNRIKVAVKKIETEVDEKKKEELLSDMDYEVQYSEYMSLYKIGPEIYSAFYTDHDNRLIQYIIMEIGDGSLRQLLKSQVHNQIKKTALIIALKKINQKVLDANLYCLDIKPDNFIYKIKEDKIDVKMIDFGRNYCTMDKIPEIYTTITKNKEDQKDLFVLILCLQLFCIASKYTNNTIEDFKEINEPFIKILEVFHTNWDVYEKVLERILSNYDAGYVFNYYLSGNLRNNYVKVIQKVKEIIKLLFT